MQAARWPEPGRAPLHGLPAVGFSQQISDQDYERLKADPKAILPGLVDTLRVSATHAAHLGPALAARTAKNAFVVHNINFPVGCTPLTQTRLTVPARVLVPKLFTPKAVDGTHSLVFNPGLDLSPGHLATDKGAIDAGFISHSRLDYSVLGH